MKEKVISLPENYDFRLLGISSNLSIHKLGWLLNTRLSFNFSLLDTPLKASENTDFSVYQHEGSQGVVNLVENKNKSGLLIKKLPNIDYLLKIDGFYSQKDFDLLVKNIRQIADIYACLIVDVNVLKKTELNLIS